MKRMISLLSLLMVGMSLLALAAQAEDKVLNIYNWADSIAPEVIAAFEQQVGVKVNYDAYDNSETMLAKLQSGATAYDVVFAEGYLLPLLIQSGLLAELDQRQLPNRGNIDPRILNLPFDPGNRYSLPYSISLGGIAYRADRITVPVESWGIVFDPHYAGRIVAWDTMRDVIALTLKYLGYSVNSVNPDELQAAKTLLLKQKPLLKAYATWSLSQFEFFFTSDEADIISPAFQPEVLYLNQKTNHTPPIRFVIPKEGTYKFLANIAIPKGAPHPDLAHQFINFLHDPQINARNANYLMFLTPNKSALPYLDKTLREVTETTLNLAPSASVEYLQDLGDGLQLWDEMWSEIKAQ